MFDLHAAVHGIIDQILRGYCRILAPTTFFLSICRQIIGCDEVRETLSAPLRRFSSVKSYVCTVFQE